MKSILIVCQNIFLTQKEVFGIILYFKRNANAYIDNSAGVDVRYKSIANTNKSNGTKAFYMRVQNALFFCSKEDTGC